MSKALKISNEEAEIIESFVAQPSTRDRFEQLKLKDKKERLVRLRSAAVVVAYGLIFMGIGGYYVNCIMTKTNYNMRMTKIKSERVRLVSELDKIKSDIDMKIDLAHIENYARTTLGMEIADKVKYIRVK